MAGPGASAQPSPGALPLGNMSNESTTSEVIASASRKRSTPDQSDGEPAVEPATKRRRVEEKGVPSPPPEDVITAMLETRPFFDDEPSRLLRRSVALVLEHIGFDGASKEALESFCGEVDSYATKFLSYVTEFMLSARRSRPTPLDFEYALRREGLTARLLKPHLKPPIPRSKVLPLFIPTPLQELVHRPAAGLLGAELDGDSEKRVKSYIPKHFPSFPSKHTYKSTDVKPDRETDPRKIREKATEEARHGEEALRRLVKVGKAGDHKSTKRASGRGTKQSKRHEMWESTMEDLAAGKTQVKSSGGDDGTEEQRIMVNAEKPYGRKGPARKRGKGSNSSG